MTTIENTHAAGANGRSRRKALARLRRWLARGLLLVPFAAMLAVDLGRRHERIATFEGDDLVFYVLSCVVSCVLWTSLYAAASRARGLSRVPVRAVLVVAGLLAIGGQLYTFGRYQAYVNHRAVLVGTSFLPSVGQQLWFDRWTFLRTISPWIALAVVWPMLLARLAPMRRRARAWLCVDLALGCVLVAAFVSPERGAEQGQPPDVMYVSAMGQLGRARWDHNEMVERLHPGPRTPEPVPPLTPRPAARRNVVLVITESVRAQSVCMQYAPDCKWTPFSNAAAPGRIALTQMRALDSTTAISLAVMWNGLSPLAGRRDEHTMPIVWEYAHAAGLETAYYTSQNLLFGNSGTWLEGAPWTRHVSATMIEPDATYETGADDGKLVDWALGDLDHLKEPYLAVVHLSNTHFPYKVDPDWLPFEPDDAPESAYENQIVNRYQDSIILQDKAIGRFVSSLRKRPEGDRTVVVFVSDHGEQMHEKGAVGHTGSLYDPEIRVPFWVDAPKGTLTASEESHLRALETTPVTELDVLPTILDLLGLWDDPGLDRFRPRYAGTSLLRGGSTPDRDLPLTNCSELWACAFKNWGAMRGTKKVIATQNEGKWSCFDFLDDPTEDHPLPMTGACADLLALAEKNGRPWQ